MTTLHTPAPAEEPHNLTHISDEDLYAEWARHFASSKVRDADFTSLSGTEREPVYGPAPGEAPRDFERIGYPGLPPFTRGLHPAGYRGRLWTIRQFAGFGSAAESNARYKDLLQKGAGGLSVAFDMPTLMGRDSDDPLALGEVGHCGVAVDSAADMDILFSGIDLASTTTSMTISGPALPLFGMYLVAAERQGAPLSSLDGTLQTDILKEFIAQKEWLFPPEPHLRLIGDLMTFCDREIPRYKPLSVSGYHIREAGSTAAQELAFTLANGLAYVELGLSRGLDINSFTKNFSFFFDAHIDFFEEVAKFRAARRIWSRHMAALGASERSQHLRFHTQTAGVSLTAQQPENNVVRTTIEALAAVLGGTQSLHTNALDETLALPSEKAARIALRTQLVLAEETGVADVADPLGGSWYVEALTDRMEEEVEALFTRILSLGDGTFTSGILRGIEKGWFLSEIADAAFAYQTALESGKKRVVGVNCYQAEEGSDLEILRISSSVEAAQREALLSRRASRDSAAVSSTLARLRASAETEENLVPLILQACREEATLGEICGTLRDLWGSYQEPTRF